MEMEGETHIPLIIATVGRGTDKGVNFLSPAVETEEPKNTTASIAPWITKKRVRNKKVRKKSERRV